MKYKKVYTHPIDKRDSEACHEQRIFEDTDGNFYIVDHSGTSPNNTDDGPIRLIVPNALVANGFSPYNGEPRFDVSVYSLRDEQNYRTSFGLGPAKFLSDKLDIPMLLKIDGKTLVLDDSQTAVTITTTTTVCVPTSQVDSFNKRQFEIHSFDPESHPQDEPYLVNHGEGETTFRYNKMG